MADLRIDALLASACTLRLFEALVGPALRVTGFQKPPRYPHVAAMPPARPKRKLIDIVGILRMIRRDEAAMGKEPKATYRVIPVTEGGFAVEAITKGAVSHTEFGFKTEDEARAWIEAKQARNSN